MAKEQTIYLCADCGAEHSKWQGRCASCNAWNTLSAFSAPKASVQAMKPRSSGFSESSGEVGLLSEIEPLRMERIKTGISELDRVLGGGLVPGSMVLLGGSPGAGKSTLLLECIAGLSSSHKVLYVSGEESLSQIALRASRLGLEKRPILLACETDIARVVHLSLSHRAKILVVDSIQVMQSAVSESSSAGSVSAVRECASELMRLAKKEGIIVLIIGHVTKEGRLAGPKVLEHAVDCSLLLESTEDERFRMLRASKNRFGAAGELGMFQMTDKGMREVSNPSAIFLSSAREQSGTVILPAREGSQTLMLELQSLATPSEGMPRRLIVGLDSLRAGMLTAVLSRFGQLKTGNLDVFTNVVGGLKIEETASDLPFLVSLFSSASSKVVPRHLVVFGEVGLGGEIRPVPQGESRLSEARKHGFTHALIPKKNAPRAPIPGLTLIPVETLEEALEQLPWK